MSVHPRVTKSVVLTPFHTSCRGGEIKTWNFNNPTNVRGEKSGGSPEDEERGGEFSRLFSGGLE